MREGDRRGLRLLLGELREPRGDVRDLALDKLVGRAEHDEVGVVDDVRARGAEVDDRLRPRALLAERVDVRHHVVFEALLEVARVGVVDVVGRRLHLLDLRGGDVEAERLLRLRERDPEPPPRAELEVVREEPEHLHRRVPLRKRRLVDRAVELALACLRVHLCSISRSPLTNRARPGTPV
jgi:hypothetical protein